MKAYQVMHCEPELTDYIAALIFAEDASKAKAIANAKTDLGDFSLIELRARRRPDQDNEAVDKPRQASARECREAGFVEEGATTCIHCGKCDYGLPEYQICDECHACAECGCADDCAMTPNA